MPGMPTYNAWRAGARRWRLAAILVLASSAAQGALPMAQIQSALTVQDDTGRALTLHGPAQRVITLAPHATELVYAAGGGAQIVGADRYSDYPKAARHLPRVGDGLRFDIERVLALKPDLLVVWAYDDGAFARQPQIAMLQRLGVPVYYSSPHLLADVPQAVARLGIALGTEETARASAARLRQQLQTLVARYRGSQPIRVFYQLGSQPIYTVNGQNIIGDALRVCGAVNVFADLPMAAPMVSRESVLLANPQAIIVGQTGAQAQEVLKSWQGYAPGLAAAAHGNLWTVDPDTMHRPGPRLITATAQLCELIDQARQRLAK